MSYAHILGVIQIIYSKKLMPNIAGSDDYLYCNRDIVQSFHCILFFNVLAIRASSNHVKCAFLSVEVVITLRAQLRGLFGNLELPMATDIVYVPTLSKSTVLNSLKLVLLI